MPTMPPALLALLVSMALVVFYNGQFWTALLADLPGLSVHTGLLVASFGVVLTVLFNLILQLVPARTMLKPVLVMLLIGAAVVSHFASSYGTVVDRHMIASLVQTDLREARDLLGLPLAARFLLLGVLPAVLIWRTRLARQSWRQATLTRGAILASSGVVLALTLSGLSQDYAFLLREHRELGQMVNPAAAILALGKFALDTPPAAGPVHRVAAHLTRELRGAGPQRPTVVVLVLGETARAANFSINGYMQRTNPELSALPVVSFWNVHSCGTSTAESVPCMFSHLGRAEFSVRAARRTENLLDILARAGLEVLWIENNSGCKGVCDRVPTVKTSHGADEAMCPGGECRDEIMLERLRRAIEQADDDMVVVLHQNGSHGPAYYRRYPERFRVFVPACETSQIQSCSTEEIRNAYDNTILYTDHFLAGVIATLDAASAHLDAAMLYVSDHGESLGEGATWLHGLPYRIAPDVQTHVPLIVWSSGEYRARRGLDQDCLQAERDDAITHDHLFHSLLGMVNVHTDIYVPGLDIFAPCQGAGVTVSRPSAPRSAAPAPSRA